MEQPPAAQRFRRHVPSRRITGLKHSEKIAPVAAAVSAVSCLACCLPLGIAAAAGSAGLFGALAVVMEPFRPWLMGISAALLLFGLWQLYSRPATCGRRNRASLAIFWLCAAIVLAMIVLPQVVAGILADRLPN